MALKPIPEGYHSVTPYLVNRGADRTLEFVRQAFGATVTEYMPRTDGRIGHAEVRIGDSIVMMSEATDEHKPMPAMLYLYVPDIDATYRRALAAGATSVAEPQDKFYGDRSGGVRDPAGNCWYIATHVEDVAADELKRRAQALMA